MKLIGGVYIFVISWRNFQFTEKISLGRSQTKNIVGRVRVSSFHNQFSDKSIEPCVWPYYCIFCYHDEVMHMNYVNDWVVSITDNSASLYDVSEALKLDAYLYCSISPINQVKSLTYRSDTFSGCIWTHRAIFLFRGGSVSCFSSFLCQTMMLSADYKVSIITSQLDQP